MWVSNEEPDLATYADDYDDCTGGGGGGQGDSSTGLTMVGEPSSACPS